MGITMVFKPPMFVGIWGPYNYSSISTNSLMVPCTSHGLQVDPNSFEEIWTTGATLRMAHEEKLDRNW